MPDEPVSASKRMQRQLESWQTTADQRTAFLSCYLLMTQNMLAAIDANQFNDAEWVYSLLQRFAEYYFNALEAYEQDSTATPAVWRRAFDAARHPGTLVLQNLLLGINAHINYDLILTLVDMLEPDWPELAEDERQGRFDDYTQVNQIITQTIDAVQDSVIEPGSAIMELVDWIGGPADEWVVSRIISDWRQEVWQRGLDLLNAAQDERPALRQQFEQAALLRADRILVTRMDAS